MRFWMPVVLASILITGSAPGQDEQASAKPGTRHALITLKVRIPNPVGSKYMKLWIPYPLSDDHQRIENVDVRGNFNQQGVYREEEFGNTMLFLRWIQVEHEVIRFVEVRCPRVHLVQFDAGEVCKPHQRRSFCCDHIVDFSFLLFASQHNMFNPLRSPLGPVLLEKLLTVDAVRETNQ